MRQDPKLRSNPNLIKTFQGLGGTLSNSIIPAAPTTQSFPRTVLSSLRIRDEVIPDLEDRTKKATETGQFVDEQGITRTADDQPVPEVDEDEVFAKNLANFNRLHGRRSNDSTGIKKLPGGGIDPTGAFDEEGVIGGTRVPIKEEEDLEDFNRQKAELIAKGQAILDATTKRTIDDIEARFEIRRQRRAEIDRRQQAGIEQTLIQGGSTRFAQLSSEGIVSAKETASLRNIIELDVEEKTLINSALAAQEAGNFRLLGLQLDLVEKKREEKQKAATKLSEEIATENAKLKEETLKIENQLNISKALDAGIKSAGDIQAFLREQGISIDLEEIEKSLKILDPEITDELKGLTADFKTFKFLQDAKDPVVEGLNFAEYTALISNAKRKEDVPKKQFVPGTKNQPSGIFDPVGETAVETAISDLETVGTADSIKGYLTAVAQEADLKEGTKTQLSNVLNVATALQDLSEANPEGEFSGLGPAEGGLFRILTGIPTVGISEAIRAGVRALSPEKIKAERVENSQFIEAINLKVQIWASGASLTTEQIKQVARITPKLSDTDGQVKRKINGLYNFMIGQTESRLLLEGFNNPIPKIDLFEFGDLLKQASPEQLAEIEALAK